jgi:hypothetical protein
VPLEAGVEGAVQARRDVRAMHFGEQLEGEDVVVVEVERLAAEALGGTEIVVGVGLERAAIEGGDAGELVGFGGFCL